jgi:hypothetical protein
MAKIAVYQVDGTDYLGVRFPNIALMKISAYHKSIGDSVEWYEGILFASKYDKIYASKIFDFSPMPEIPENMVIGGTGIDFFNNLPEEIENMPIDWELYPNTPFHYGFTMKGCRFNEKTCPWCCVPKKEGRPYNYNSIDELLTNPSGKNNLMLLDNDFFGGSDWEANLNRIIELNLKVCFVQGLNIRIISEKQAELLSKCRYYNSKFNKRYLTFAWDRTEDEKAIYRGIERLNKYGIPPSHQQFFVLIGAGSSIKEDEHRVESIRRIGAKPFVMPFNKKDKYQKAYARYVNNRWIFNSCSWRDYEGNPFLKSSLTQTP